MGTKETMDNTRSVDEEIIPLVQDEDYDLYNTPDPSRVNETSFTEFVATKALLNLQLRQKIKRDKFIVMYRYLNVTGYPGLADIYRFTIKENSKTGKADLLFLMEINIGNPLLINVLVRF